MIYPNEVLKIENVVFCHRHVSNSLNVKERRKSERDEKGENEEGI